MDTTLDRLISHPSVLFPALLCLAYLFWSQLAAKSRVPKNLPWVGRYEKQAFSKTRAALRSFNGCRQNLKDGYEKYSKKGKSYIFPDLSGPEVIIPRAKLRWLLDFPDAVSSVGAAHYDQLEGDYNFTSPYILKTLYHEHVLHKSLARRIGALIPGTWDELSCTFDDTWGTDTTQWRTITVFENMQTMVNRASNRMFVGPLLCRDEGYTRAMGAFAQDVIRAMMLLKLCPSFLKPMIGWLMTVPNRRHWAQSAAYTVPLIKQRIADMERKEREPDWKWEEPNDYVSWHVRIARQEGKTVELDPVMISRFLMPINFAAIHTTQFTITNTLFDLLGSPEQEGYLAGIREEAERVHAECGGVWSKESLAELVRADSAIRESMRVSNFATRGILRKIIDPAGISDKEEGWHVPQGAWVGTDIHSVHHDPEIYPEPNRYDAFRFSRPREEYEEKLAGGEKIEEGEGLKLANTVIVSTGETFLPFGHGRHACPGRFFVSHELKMLLAYMVMNYDVEHLTQRPANTWFGSFVSPPTKAAIRVKRREGTVKTANGVANGSKMKATGL